MNLGEFIMGLEIIKSMLEEELDRKKRAVDSFNNELKNPELKKIYIKNVNGNSYFYENDNEGGKFHYKMIGSIKEMSESEKDRLMENSQRYENNINSIRSLNDDISKLERMVKIIG